MTRLGDWDLLIPDAREPRAGETAVLEVGIKTTTEANTCESWQTKHFGRAEPQKGAVHRAWVRAGLPRVEWQEVLEGPVEKPRRRHIPIPRAFTPARVLLVRLAPGQLDDDNLPGSLKHIRDAVAELLGFNDRVRIWAYDQQKANGYAVRIEVAWPLPNPPETP